MPGWLVPPVEPLVDAGASLLLRPWGDGDGAALAAAWADPTIAARSSVPADGGLAAASAWIDGWSRRAAAGQAVDLAVASLAEPAEVWGEVGLRPQSSADGARRVAELGWWVRADRREQGVGAAAVGLVVTWAIATLPIEAVVARIAPGHQASEATARRAGLSRRGRFDTVHDLWSASKSDGDAST